MGALKTEDYQKNQVETEVSDKNRTILDNKYLVLR